MYCIMVEVDLNSAEFQMSAIQREDLKSLILRSLNDFAPEASVSFVGDGYTEKGSAWIVLAHTLDIVSSKTLVLIEKGIKVYVTPYGNPRFSMSTMVEL